MLSGPLGVAQPNNTALLLGIDARVKILQGGGPFPVISGTIQLPEIQNSNKIVFNVYHFDNVIY